MPRAFDDFHAMKLRRETAASCCRAAHAAGLETISQIRMLREVFGLSPVQAKETVIVADGRWASLDDHQKSLLPALEAAVKRLSESGEKV